MSPLRVLLESAEAHRRAGRLALAEVAFSRAWDLDATCFPAAEGLCRVRLAMGRPGEAVTAAEALADRHDAPASLLEIQARALKTCRRLHDALALHRRIVAIKPSSGTAEHNLAAVLGDLGQVDAAEAASRRALAKGLTAPELWLVRARALLALGRLDEADRAFRTALAGRPDYVDAHRDLAQLIWMRTEDLSAATQALRCARDGRASPSLILIEMKLMEAAGETRAALDLGERTLAAAPDHPELILAVVRLLAATRPVEAVASAEAWLARRGPSPNARLALVEACLAAGDPQRAVDVLDILRADRRDEQYLIALTTTAWRLLGDRRAVAWCDPRLLREVELRVGPGWRDLPGFLDELASVIGPLHHFRTHPVGQSVRRGSQTSRSLVGASHPVLHALFQALDEAVRDYLAEVGPGSDPFRRRNDGSFAVQGAWSIRLRSGGYHVDHVHPEGWLSAVLYVETPPAARGQDRQGWLRIGQPGIPLAGPLAPQGYVQPEPGKLVLFPSHFWHGTQPFEGSGTRLTCAFDIVPAFR